LQCAQTFGYTAHLQQDDLVALRMQPGMIER
jgi:hypothetical protein